MMYALAEMAGVNIAALLDRIFIATSNIQDED